jgi:NAD(P)-dependent dehydrogenase (short-subunit alcohol dehydrogenase family)
MQGDSRTARSFSSYEVCRKAHPTSRLPHVVAITIDDCERVLAVLLKAGDDLLAVGRERSCDGVRRSSRVMCELLAPDPSRRTVTRFADFQVFVDVLVNDVGAVHTHRWKTADRSEGGLAMNVVGPVALTRKLLPLLCQASGAAPRRAHQRGRARRWVSAGAPPGTWSAADARTRVGIARSVRPVVG